MPMPGSRATPTSVPTPQAPTSNSIGPGISSYDMAVFKIRRVIVFGFFMFNSRLALHEVQRGTTDIDNFPRTHSLSAFLHCLSSLKSHPEGRVTQESTVAKDKEITEKGWQALETR